MIKWGKCVVDWKKVNVNKVSYYYDTCRRLCMILLQELERLSIDLFLESKYSSSTYSELTMSIDIAKEYSSFLRNNSTTDQRRQYMFGFIIMATEFRKYWKAVRCGDRIVMEQIQNIWIGVHLLSGKHKCVENYLTGVETEYGRVSNITLQEIRMNISCRYHKGKDKRGNEFKQHPLDEVQENINAWTKRILLGPDEVSWRLHSPNVACAHMCVNFEESEYVKTLLDFSDVITKTKKTHRSTKTVAPIAVIEKQRLYEWVVIMFNKEISNRVCFISDGYNAIKQLKVELKRNKKQSKPDELENCINSIFSKTVETEAEVDDNEVDDGETVEVIHDDYTYITQQNEQDTTNSTTNSTINNTTNSTTTIGNGSVSKLGLSNIFDQGRAKLVEMKVPLVRERKQNRMKRSQAFFLNVHETVSNRENEADVELNTNTTGMIPHPWFRKCYRTVIDY